MKLIHQAYERFKDEPGLARVATLEEIRAKDGNLSIPLYVAPAANGGSDASAAADTASLPAALARWLESSVTVNQALAELLGGTRVEKR